MDIALRADIIYKNPMDLVKNLSTDSVYPDPLSIKEVNLFLAVVDPYYRTFFIGMRFGEMAALKWKNVSLKLGVIKVRETRDRRIESRPKTKGSVRDIKILPLVKDALKTLRRDCVQVTLCISQ